MPPQYVKAYVKRSKNDAADAAAICEAVTRPSMRFVPVKTEEQQSALTMHRVRELLVRQRTQLINAVRGHLAEFGLVGAQGPWNVPRLLASMQDDRRVPQLARPSRADRSYSSTARRTSSWKTFPVRTSATSRGPRTACNCYGCTNPTIRRGFIRGCNAPSGMGVLIENGSGGSGGRVEDVDVVYWVTAHSRRPTLHRGAVLAVPCPGWYRHKRK